MKTDVCVLFVDDEHKLCKLIHQQLETELGAKNVRSATSGTDALAVLENHSFDVLVTDLRMPKMNGIDLMKKALEIDPDIQTIIITGHGDLDNAIEAMRKGAVNYIRKPLDLDELMLSILKAAENRVLKKKLKENEARFRSTFMHSAAGMAVLTPEGNITDVNPALCRITQFNENDLKKKRIYDLTENNGGVDFKNFIEQPPGKKNDEYFLEDQLQTGTGKRLWVHIVLSSFHSEIDGKWYNIAQFIDLTEQKRLHEELKTERTFLSRRVEKKTAELRIANAELSRAARMKDEFMANMSHELRTPLNSILGMSEALQDEVYGPVNKRQEISLRRIEESGRHLLSLINDILDISKIEAGKLEIDIGQVSVESIIQSSMRMIREIAIKKKLNVSTNYDSEILYIRADERRLKQILVNLLSNSVKFTPEGGDIGLDIHADAENNRLCFSVWDTGIGISRDDQEKLFTPFVQLDSSLSKSYEGTGLGLALVMRLVKILGGDIVVESEKGKGSRFTLTLDLEPPDMA